MKATKSSSTKKSLNVIIPLIVYPFDVMFSIAETEDEFRANLDKFGAEYDSSLAFQGHALGRATLLPCNRSIIRLVRYPKSPNNHGVLAHEIFHIVDFLLSRIGMNLTDSSGEAYAYLLGYITEQIYKALSLKNPAKEGITDIPKVIE